MDRGGRIRCPGETTSARRPVKKSRNGPSDEDEQVWVDRGKGGEDVLSWGCNGRGEGVPVMVSVSSVK